MSNFLKSANVLTGKRVMCVRTTCILSMDKTFNIKCYRLDVLVELSMKLMQFTVKLGRGWTLASRVSPTVCHNSVQFIRTVDRLGKSVAIA